MEDMKRNSYAYLVDLPPFASFLFGEALVDYGHNFVEKLRRGPSVSHTLNESGTLYAPEN